MNIGKKKDKLSAILLILNAYSKKESPEHVKDDPFKVLIGCILSQRTRDETTDLAYRKLFQRYKTIEELAKADPKDVEKLIYPVGFYRVKSKTIVRAAKYILENLGGRVPESFEELLKIPGIGRKCANIVLAYGFGIPAIPVDTHVARVARRLGIVPEGASEEEVENVLKRIVPREKWIDVNHALVRFGQEICKPVRPVCEKCFIREKCAYYARA